jgi:hypothetical protein
MFLTPDSLEFSATLTIPNAPFSEHHSVFFYTSYVKKWDGTKNTTYSYPEWEALYNNLIQSKPEVSLNFTYMNPLVLKD